MNVYRHKRNGELYRIYQDRYYCLYAESYFPDRTKLKWVIKPSKIHHFYDLNDFDLVFVE